MSSCMHDMTSRVWICRLPSDFDSTELGLHCYGLTVGMRARRVRPVVDRSCTGMDGDVGVRYAPVRMRADGTTLRGGRSRGYGRAVRDAYSPEI